MIYTRIFSNADFGSIRIVLEADQLFFCGKDVAEALCYAEPRKAIARLAAEAQKRPVHTAGGVQTMTVIPESDVSRLVEYSKRPDAQSFRQWLFCEVVPYIYGDKTKQLNERQLKSADQTGHMETMFKALSGPKEKSGYFDAFVAVGACTNISVVAKQLNIPRGQFISFLLKGGFLYRNVRGELLPYKEAMDKEIFAVKDFYRNGHYGVYTLITPKGKNLFRLLKAESGEEDEIA